MDSTTIDRIARLLGRRSSRRTAIVGSAGVAAVGLVERAGAKQATPDASFRTGAEGARYLFVQTGGATRLEPESDGGHVLTIEGASLRTLYFTDRPIRDAGTMTTEDFVDIWPAIFGGDPPNATLVGHGAAGGEDEVAVVELLEVAYDAGADDLWYSVRILDPEEIGPHGFEREPITAADRPHVYATAELFIDAACVCCNGAVLGTVCLPCPGHCDPLAPRDPLAPSDSSLLPRTTLRGP